MRLVQKSRITGRLAAGRVKRALAADGHDHFLTTAGGGPADRGEANVQRAKEDQHRDRQHDGGLDNRHTAGGSSSSSRFDRGGHSGLAFSLGVTGVPGPTDTLEPEPHPSELAQLSHIQSNRQRHEDAGDHSTRIRR